jgi:peroxin-6
LNARFTLDPELNLWNVVEKLPFNYTGADFYALCTDAMMNAIKRKIELVEERVCKSSFFFSILQSSILFLFPCLFPLSLPSSFNSNPAMLQKENPKLTTQLFLLEHQEREKKGEPSKGGADGLAVEVNLEDFERAIEALIPSVSMAELAHYRKVQRMFTSDQDKKEKKEEAGNKQKGKAVEKG